MQHQHLTRRSFLGISAVAAVTALSGGLLAGCSSTTASGSGDAAPDTIVVACLAREEPDVRFIAEKLADKYIIEAKVFGDNNAINEATLDGSVQVNYFQNVPYLTSWNQSKGTNLQTYGDAVFYTIDILVSKKYKTLDELPEGAKILVANDNANRGRELKLLESAGLLKLTEGVELPTTFDIVENPKNLEIVEVDARSRVGALPDADAMVAPSITVYQMNDPDLSVETALAKEEPEAYEAAGGTILVVTPETGDAAPQWLQGIDSAFHTQEFADFLQETYKGAKAAKTR